MKKKVKERPDYANGIHRRVRSIRIQETPLKSPKRRFKTNLRFPEASDQPLQESQTPGKEVPIEEKGICETSRSDSDLA
jgi:hypothetical protein